MGTANTQFRSRHTRYELLPSLASLGPEESRTRYKLKGSATIIVRYRAYVPRRHRFQLDNVPLHIVQRGHNREACFLGVEDYQSYLHWLEEALHKHDCKLHAYVLMTNHVHLLLTPKKADLIPRFVLSIGRRYVQYINRTYGRTGTLWDSRYKSSGVHADSYLLICQRYIELNPVLAAMVDDPAHYRWSSYRHNALGHPDSHLSPHPVYAAMAASDERHGRGAGPGERLVH